MAREVDLGSVIGPAGPLPALVKNLNGLEKGALDAEVGPLITALFKSLKNSETITLSATKWSNTYPYSQVVAVNGLSGTDAPVLSLYLPQGLDAIAVKAKNKAFSCLYRAVSGSGKITFYAYKKPETDFQVSIKGV